MEDQVAFGKPWIWPTIVIALLFSQLAICLVTVYFAISDPSFAVEPNYYARAQNWDRTKATVQMSRALGWESTLDISSTPNVVGERIVTLKIKDRHGENIENATVFMTAFHHARPGEASQIGMQPTSSGKFTAMIPMRKDGLWEFQITTRVADNVFQTVKQYNLNSTTDP